MPCKTAKDRKKRLAMIADRHRKAKKRSSSKGNKFTEALS